MGFKAPDTFLIVILSVADVRSMPKALTSGGEVEGSPCMVANVRDILRLRSG